MSPKTDENNTALRILLMDDEAIIRDITSAMLEDSGHTVLTAKDGKSAIDCYQSALSANQRFDVVIMDLTIPGGLGGKEAINQLLTMDPEAKVIVSSGYASDPILADYHHYGFAGKLAKPFKLEELERELNRVMNE